MSGNLELVKYLDSFKKIDVTIVNILKYNFFYKI